MMQMDALPPATAMHVLYFLNLIWSLLRNLFCTLFQSVTQRFRIEEESAERDPSNDDANESLLLNKEDEVEQEMRRLSSYDKCMSDDSAEFELPPIARASDVEMETEYPVSALFLNHDALTQPLATSAEIESKFDLVQKCDSHSDSDCEFGYAAIQQRLKMIEKLRMDEKSASKGHVLPTILEDRESAKVAEDMKPLRLNNKKIDEHKYLLEQVHAFHKTYADKMHKLDILNQQTLTAMSIMGLKGEAQDGLMHKKSKKMSLTIGAMRSAFSVKYLCAKVSCDEAEALKSSGGLMSRLELIYVGQLCLSWEILNWQYSRAIKLQSLDMQASHLYNQAVDEFKQFQVTLQRFVENEASQGHTSTRVRNYIEKRAAFSGFLQVPLFKDDSLKDKKLNKGECIATISKLVKIISECRKIFCEFLREKKHGGTTKVVPYDQSSVALLVQAQAKLHRVAMKKKWVREMKGSRGSIVKIMRHTKGQPWLDQELFDALVELKLVSRVLRMAAISRDQILWCHRKLDEIKLVGRRFNIEPTFLPFPC